MRKTIGALAALTVALALVACGGSGETKTTVKTVTVAGTTPKTETAPNAPDTAEQVIAFTTAGDGYRPDMEKWFIGNMCDGRSAFACRCMSDRISWQHDTADDYADFVTRLLVSEQAALDTRAEAEERCDGLTSEAVMGTLSSENLATLRSTIADMKRATAKILGERVSGAPDDITCGEWARTPRSVRRALATAIIDGQPMDALFAQASSSELLGRIDLGCEESPDESASGWIAAEMVIAGGGESTLP